MLYTCVRFYNFFRKSIMVRLISVAVFIAKIVLIRIILLLLYTHLPYHNDSIIIKTDARRNEGRMKASLQIYSLQGFERVRGCWRPNIIIIFWPHCYDHHVVSFLFSWCWGLLHRGCPRAPSIGCGLPYHIASLTLWESAGNCSGTQTQLS